MFRLIFYQCSYRVYHSTILIQNKASADRKSQAFGLSRFRERVLVLPVTDDQHSLPAAFIYHELESIGPRVDCDEGGSSVIVLSRRHRALPLAEIEDRASVVSNHIQVAQFFARIVL